ncbi:glycosyltransferase family 2 protein [Hyaloscypha bicolor E]|uniref:Glycosyltransferase family 2 protein n=1 Tax=Hyaloscypha bicolor E TaxID=1095630 RepID=A0A2J6T406_9HELO|nr:glycosyltransferase family 2 protein [Hyaloscypha bicolor E]PMD57758.1 glycosyltransferase family 2 protein [Hyaloscypha bicolor E]
MLLAVFKGLKIFVHVVSYYLWTRPVPAPINPTITPEDVTVIVPTVCCFEQEFVDCIDSILINQPARIIISVVGHEKKIQAIRVCEKIDARIEVVSTPEANKRTQLLKAVQGVRTPITVYADDHVFWPPTFLRSALAPFEDPIVGLAGTSKRVWRNRNLPFWDNFFNYIACIYLERHNFECTATYNIDGGVFVVSGRTVLLRTSALHSLEYRTEFQDEYFVGIGPMKVDDDNFNTRFMVRHGYRTVFHNDPSATIETTLVHGTGQITKFRDQLLRWSRTTWRSNLKSLLTDRACYQRTPWTTYAMFISSFVNFALFYDLGLYWSLKWSGAGHMCAFCMVLALSKLIKPLPHLAREWQDWKWVPMGILFAYAHSFIKLYSLWTIRDVAWSGRSGIKATA